MDHPVHFPRAIFDIKACTNAKTFFVPAADLMIATKMLAAQSCLIRSGHPPRGSEAFVTAMSRDLAPGEPPNAVFIAFSFASIILSAIPLSWHRESSFYDVCAVAAHISPRRYQSGRDIIRELVHSGFMHSVRERDRVERERVQAPPNLVRHLCVPILLTVLRAWTN